MSELYVASDHHLNHRRCWETFRSEYDCLKGLTLEEYNQLIIDRHNEKVGKRGKTFFLGDVLFGNNFKLIEQMNGHKEIALGNHDRNKIQDYLRYFKSIFAVKNYKNKFVFSHVPIHPSQLEHRWQIPNVHGHMHHLEDLGDNYLNVNIEFNNFYPWSIDELIEHFKSKGIKIG